MGYFSDKYVRENEQTTVYPGRPTLTDEQNQIIEGAMVLANMKMAIVPGVDSIIGGNVTWTQEGGLEISNWRYIKDDGDYIDLLDLADYYGAVDEQAMTLEDRMLSILFKIAAYGVDYEEAYPGGTDQQALNTAELHQKERVTATPTCTVNLGSTEHEGGITKQVELITRAKPGNASVLQVKYEHQENEECYFFFKVVVFPGYTLS